MLRLQVDLFCSDSIYHINGQLSVGRHIVIFNSVALFISRFSSPSSSPLPQQLSSQAAVVISS